MECKSNESGIELDNSALQTEKMPQYNNVRLEDVSVFIKPYQVEINIETYFRNFEEAAVALGLTSTQKLIYIRKLFTGHIADFLDAEPIIHSFDELKRLVINEFASQINIAELHRRLAKNEKSPNETHVQYFYRTRRIAALGQLDDESVKYYVINGLKEKRDITLQLSSSPDLNQLKFQMKVMDKIEDQNRFEKPFLLPIAQHQQNAVGPRQVPNQQIPIYRQRPIQNAFPRFGSSYRNTRYQQPVRNHQRPPVHTQQFGTPRYVPHRYSGVRVDAPPFVPRNFSQMRNAQ